MKGAHAQRAVLVGLRLTGAPETSEAPLAELRRLAETAGATVVGELFQTRPKPDPATFIGRGKAQEVAALAASTNAELVLFDNDLSPAQTRNLEKLTGRRVVDRSLLILDIFDRHATDLQAAYLDQDGEAPQPKRWVPLETLFGTHGIPAGAASTVARALARMRDQEEITDRNPWQALEYWAADYLAGT